MKTLTIKKAKTTSKTIKGLKSKKKYYIRIRTYLTFNGKTKTIAEWSIITNLTQPTIRHRIERGWTVEKTLTTPQRNKL